MFRSIQFHFDNFSFLLGIAFAGLLWWGIIKLREMIKNQRAEKETGVGSVQEPVSSLKPVAIDQNLSSQKLQNNIADIYRRELFFFAQKQHLAAKYCPLQEILIEPNLVAAPYEVDPLLPYPPETLTSQVVPYLPDFPEFISQYPIPKISTYDSLRNGVNIVIYGQAGSGKSVALANLVTVICSDSSSLDEVRSRIPIYLHWLDLNYSPQVETDPFDVLLNGVNTQIFLKSKNNCLAYLKQSISTQKYLLILDGLDELHPDEFQIAVKYLDALIRKYPNIQFITTASEDYFDGFHRIESRAFCVASWSTLERQAFLDKWVDVWNRYVSTTRGERSDETTRLVKKWLEEDNRILTPFEWTLRLWALFSGRLKGLTTAETIEAYLESISGNSFNAQNLTLYSRELITQKKSALSESASEKILSRNPKNDETAQNDTNSGAKKEKNKKIISSGELIIRNLVDNSAGAYHGRDTFAINHPLIIAYCASLMDSESQIPSPPNWSLEFQRLRFIAGRITEPGEIISIIENEDLPLHRNLLVVSRFLKDSPLESRWRVNLMRRLVYLIKQDTLPLGLRMSFMAVAVASRDSSLSVLFKQLFGSASPEVRRISVLGAGVARDRNVTQELIRMMGDQSLEVRCAACLALGNIPGSASWQATIDALIKGEEHLQQVAAECLAASGEKGYDVLRNAVTFDNILVRRAAVIGFSQVREKWCVSLLEKIAVEDGQWVVRNAASQALEMIHQKNIYIPRHFPNPDSAPWLVQFAARQGTTLTEGEFPKAMLNLALTNGNQEEKLAALNYLRFVTDENSLKSFYDIFYAAQTPERDSVFQYLWWMVMCGVRLPSPIQYGFK
jgi:HEAT repeat protein